MSMKIDHIAIWTQDIERSISFYKQYFNAQQETMHVDEDERFYSCFLSFTEGAKLEVMQAKDVENRPYTRFERKVGLTHFTFAVPNQADVNDIAHEMKEAGYDLEKLPQMMDDGYYECAIFDPDGNIVEVVAQS